MTCPRCGRIYNVVVNVKPELWEKIRPPGEPKDAGMHCGLCIIEGIEQRWETGAFRLLEITPNRGRSGS